MADIANHPWVARASAQLEHLATLKPGWDSYGAEPIAGGAIAAARRFITHLALMSVAAPNLHEPAVVPTPGGGVQVEWTHPGGAWAEIEFTAAGGVEAAAQDLTGVEWEMEEGDADG